MRDHHAEVTRTVVTDTATLVVFDEVALAEKADQECDWWTGEDDLLREEVLRTLAFIDVGSDGTYELRIRVGGRSPEGVSLRRSSLHVPSGEILFGAAECLPGEGAAIRERLGQMKVDTGVYTVETFSLNAPPGEYPRFGVWLRVKNAG